MLTSARPQYPIAIVAAGNITTPGHYEGEAETLTAVIERIEQNLPNPEEKHKKFLVQTFPDDERAIAFLDTRERDPNYRGTLVFLSGSKVPIANKIAADREDIHVVVFTGMGLEPRKAVVIPRMWRSNDRLALMLMPG